MTTLCHSQAMLVPLQFLALGWLSMALGCQQRWARRGWSWDAAAAVAVEPSGSAVAVGFLYSHGFRHLRFQIPSSCCQPQQTPHSAVYL